MSGRAPLVLAAVLVLLAVYALVFERDRPSQSEIEARHGFLLESLVNERITRIRMNDAVVLRREGEGFDETWVFETPNWGEANFDEVVNYVQSWEFAVPTRTLEDPSPEDRTAFGLNAPKSLVTFEMGRATTTVTLAAGDPIDGGGYVQVEGKTGVAVVPPSVVELFGLGAEHFRLAPEDVDPDLDALIGADAAPAEP